MEITEFKTINNYVPISNIGELMPHTNQSVKIVAIPNTEITKESWSVIINDIGQFVTGTNPVLTNKLTFISYFKRIGQLLGYEDTGHKTIIACEPNHTLISGFSQLNLVALESAANTLFDVNPNFAIYVTPEIVDKIANFRKFSLGTFAWINQTLVVGGEGGEGLESKIDESPDFQSTVIEQDQNKADETLQGDFIEDNYSHLTNNLFGEEEQKDESLPLTLEQTVIDLKDEIEYVKQKSNEEYYKSKKELDRAMEQLAIETAKNQSINDNYEKLLNDTQKRSSENNQLIKFLIEKQVSNQKEIENLINSSKEDKNLINRLNHINSEMSENVRDFKFQSAEINDEIAHLREQLQRETFEISNQKGIEIPNPKNDSGKLFNYDNIRPSRVNFSNVNETRHTENSPSTEIKSEQTHHTMSKIITPKQMGITDWNSAQTPIQTHINKIRRISTELLKMGVSQNGMCRFLIQSLGSNFSYIEDFIDPGLYNNFSRFCEEVQNTLGEKSLTQMSSFLTAQRKKGENLLLYFSRILNLYSQSKNWQGSQTIQWQYDPSHTPYIYTKIFDACYPEHQMILQAKLDEYLEQGTLTLQRLKGCILDIHKLSKAKIESESVQPINAVEELGAISKKRVHWKPELQEKEPSTSNGGAKEGPKPFGFNKRFGEFKPVRQDGREFVPRCWFCQSTNHFKYYCPKYKQFKLTSMTKESRDTEGNDKDGRRAFAHVQ